MGMLSNDELKVVRDALLEGDALTRVDKIQDELEEIKFSEIFDKVKRDKEDPISNPDKPEVDEPDFELFDEGLDFDDYGNLDIDAFEKSNDVDDLISETDKVVNQLFENEDMTSVASEDYDFDAFLESEFAIDNGESDALTENDVFGDVADIDALEESLNVDLLESEFTDIGPLEESVILEEAEAMAQLDSLSEQIIRDVESKDSDMNAHTTRNQGLYEDEDEDLAIDDDFDGIAEDYVDPADIELVDRFLEENPEEDVIEEPAVAVDTADVEDDINPIYAEDPEADLDGDGIPDVEEPHGELPADYEPSEYDEYDHGYADDLDECDSMQESEDLHESDDLSFLFESDDETDSDDDEDDEGSDDDSDSDDNDDSSDDDDSNSCDDDNDDSDDEDIEFDDGDEDSDDDNDEDEDDDNDNDDEEDDEDLDLSFDEDDEE